MGRPDQLAKRVFRDETAPATGGRVAFRDAPEIATGALTPDGLVYLATAAAVPAALPAPWSLLVVEAVLDFKMPGDHLDEMALARVEFRRHARWVQVLEATARGAPADPAAVAAWVVAPYLPPWLRDPMTRGAWTVTPVGPGCHALGPGRHALVWVAANELPLHPALLPFLVARSGRALFEFVEWALTVKGPEWVVGVLQEMPMASEYLNQIPPVPTDAAEQERLHDELLRRWLKQVPRVTAEVTAEGRAEGVQQGLQQGLEPLRHQFERRLGRRLGEAEQATLVQRLGVLGPDRLGDVVLDLAPPQLAAWLGDPDAR